MFPSPLPDRCQNFFRCPGLLTELHSTGDELYLHKQAINTTTPSGRAMFQMIRDRVMAGLAVVKATGACLRGSASLPADSRPVYCLDARKRASSRRSHSLLVTVAPP